MKNLIFYRCNHCGNVVIKLVDKKVPVFCCGEAMQELKPNTTDGAIEKHKPVLTVKDDVVEVVVGDVLHPMMENHYITNIILKTDKGYYVKDLLPSDEPKTEFCIKNEKIENVYAYCNLHGLWAGDLN